MSDILKIRSREDYDKFVAHHRKLETDLVPGMDRFESKIYSLAQDEETYQKNKSFRNVICNEPGFYSRLIGSHCYRNCKETIAQGEKMMRGDHSDDLWRKVEESASKLIWC